ncbi:MAG TPA: hypothetical protein PKO06_01815 [Candidatus Ozemobacteraceae bacterium]|nr:hypothetical protein [Candidatus Ozemobacteraceae bacterium]
MTFLGQTPRQWFEFLLLFGIVLITLIWSIPQGGGAQVSGLLLLAAVLSYGLFFSPHVISQPAAHSSRTEAFTMVAWSMALVWGVMPLGPECKRIAQGLLWATAAYILFVSPWRHGDTLEDRGLGTLPGFFTYLKQGEYKWLARTVFMGGNLLLIVGCFAATNVLQDVVAGALRRMGGLRIPRELPAWAWLAISLGLYNFLICFLMRWDNLSRAGPMILTYLASGILFVVLFGYWYIYLKHSGWVELVPERGFKRISSYILWGTLQELLFLSYFNTRIRKGVSSPLLAAVLTATIFSVFHLRAYTLMIICYLIGIVWALMFQAAPNLMLMGLAHGIGGGFGSAFAVQGMTMFKINARVGPFHPPG